MAGDEDWRFRKAQELGLVDTRPVVFGAGRRQPPAPRATPPAPPPSAQPAPLPAAAPPPIAAPRPAPAETPARPLHVRTPSPLMVAAIAIAMLVSAAAGWWLRATLGQPDLAMTSAAAMIARQKAAAALPPVRAMLPTTAPTPVPPNEIPPTSEVVAAATPPLATVTIAAPPVAAPVRPATAKPRSARRPAPVATTVARPSVRDKAGQSDTRLLPPARVVSSRDAAASFDCRRARTDVNRMICGDARLGALDTAMSDAYRAAVRRGGLAAEFDLDRDQASFLNARASCETPGCVARITRQRLDDLAGY